MGRCRMDNPLGYWAARCTLPMGISRSVMPPPMPAWSLADIALQSIPCDRLVLAAAQPEYRMQTSFLLSEESQFWQLGSVTQEPEGRPLPQSVQRHRGQSFGGSLLEKAGSALALTCRSDVQRVEHRPGSQDPWALSPALSLTCGKVPLCASVSPSAQ